jgi:hypothetical protein
LPCPLISQAIFGKKLRGFREERVIEKADVDGSLDPVVCLSDLQVVKAPAAKF